MSALIWLSAWSAIMMQIYNLLNIKSDTKLSLAIYYSTIITLACVPAMHWHEQVKVWKHQDCFIKKSLETVHHGHYLTSLHKSHSTPRPLWVVEQPCNQVHIVQVNFDQGPELPDLPRFLNRRHSQDSSDVIIPLYAAVVTAGLVLILWRRRGLSLDVTHCVSHVPNVDFVSKLHLSVFKEDALKIG